nr:helicase SRCAP-like [Aegilops tauschii subsp. strangulata]
MCYLCKDTGHPAALCPDRPLTDELMMYGHGIEGLGFFHVEVDDLPPPSPSLQAIVTVVGVGVASSEMVEAELNHLCRRVWDWQVTLTSASSFTVVFPNSISLGLWTRSDNITLALNKLVVNTSEPKADPKAVAVPDTAWILIAGLPDVARSERVIRSMSKILGKVVVVDELSLRKEEEVRVKVKCLDSDKLRVTIRVFFNDLGFDLKISPEPPNHVGRPRFSDDEHFGGGGTDRRDDSHYRRPRPSRHEDPDDDDERSGHSRSPSRDPTPSRGGTGASSGRSRGLTLAVGAAPAVLPAAAPSSSAEMSDISSVGLLVTPPSSPRSPCSTPAPGPPPPTLEVPLLAPADPPSDMPPSGELLLLGSPEGAPALPVAASPEPVVSASPEDRPPAPDSPSPALPRSDACLEPATTASPTSLPATTASPTALPLGVAADVATPVAPHPPRTVPYACRARASSTPVTASRRSARLDADRPTGGPPPSISERAEIRAAALNLESGAIDIPPPPSSSSCSFSALEAVPLGNLAKVAADSSVVFRGEVGPPLKQIAAIQAREILDGKLAETRARLLRTPAPQPSALDIRGRTRSRTAALRASSASSVLGSSSPRMGV